MGLSTKHKLVLLVAGSLLLLAVGAGLLSKYSVEKYILETQRRNSVNTVALAALNIQSRFMVLFSEKSGQAVALRHRMDAFQKIIAGLALNSRDPVPLLEKVPLPEEVTLVAVVPPDFRIRLVRGKLESNPYFLHDIKNRPVGQTMLRLAEKGLPAAGLIHRGNGEERQSAYGTHFFLPEAGLLVGLWINIAHMEKQQWLKREQNIRELQKDFSQIRLGPSGFIFVLDKTGEQVIGPENLQKDFSRINRLTGRPLLEDIRMAARGGETVPVLSGDILQDGSGREATLFVRYVKAFDWYVTGTVYDDEAVTPGRRLSLLLIFGMLAAMLVTVFIAVPLTSRLTAPLTALAGYARKIPELDFMEADQPPPLLRALAGGGHGREVMELAQSFIFMDKTLRARVRELMEAASGRERLEGELAAAAEIQMNFLPEPLPPDVASGRFALAAQLVPAREVGGDLYDFFMPDNTHLCFVIGDVSGKGIPASLFMSMTLTLIRSHAGGHPSPEKLLSRVNRSLARDNPAVMFVSLFIGVLDLATGEIRYANGGHNPPLLFSRSGAVSWLEGVSGPVAGAVEDAEYTLLHTRARSGDTLFLYTDGVNEAMNEQKILYSSGAMAARLASSPSHTPSGIISHMADGIKAHVNGQPASDDITMLCLQYLGSAPPEKS